MADPTRPPMPEGELTEAKLVAHLSALTRYIETMEKKHPRKTSRYRIVPDGRPRELRDALEERISLDNRLFWLRSEREALARGKSHTASCHEICEDIDRSNLAAFRDGDSKYRPARG